MAGPVKGTIGQDEVTLNDAATETTLLKMLAAIQKSGGGGGGAAQSSEKELVKMAKATGKTTKELEDFDEQIEETSSALARGFGQVTAMLAGLGHEFLGGATSISDFTSHITGALSAIPIVGPLVGGALQLLIGVVDANVQTFRELSQVGIDFGDSLFGAKLAATQAGLSLETFQSVIQSNAQSLALFGGSASEGAKRFAQISGQIQKNMGPTFSRLGLTMEETAEYTADYLELQTSLGRSQRMSNRELTAGVSSTVMEIDKLARVTGKRRDQIMAEMKDNMADKRLKLIFNTMDEAAQKNLNGVMTMMGDASPGLKNAIAEMVATGGVPLDAMGQDLIRLNPNLAAMSEGLRDGTVTQDQFMAEIRKTAEAADNMTDAQKQQYSTLQAMGSEVGSAVVEIIGMKNAGKGLTEVQKQQKEAEKSRAKGLADFERILQDAKNKIYDALIKSGVFKVVEDTLGSFTTWLGSPEGIEKIKSFATTLSDKFKELVDAFKNGNLMATIGGYLADGLSGLGGMIMSKIFGGGEEKEEKGPPGTGSAPAASSGGMFGGIDGALEKLALMVAAGGTVYLAIKGFQTLLRGFAGPQVILGAATLAGLLIGTGAAIKLAGDGIGAAGTGIEKMAAGVERMAAVKDTANLKEVAVALGDLGSAMLGLAAGGVLDSIASFFGVKSPFDKMVDGINKFGAIDGTAVENLVASSGGLQGLKSFADDLNAKNVEDFADALDKLVDQMKDLNAELSKDNNGFFKKGTGPNAGSFLSGGSGGEGISSSNMETLITLMRENNTLTRRILEKDPESAY